jgi:phosphoribosylformylglycinamidine cyclo-ligase
MINDNAYAQAGVDITAGQRATDLMKAAVRATYGPEVLAGIGAFGGLYDAAALKEMAAPVLVASTDGVGTKTRVAARLNCWDTIGRDLVNHCVNDILVPGARPLFFLDYVATSRLEPEQIAAVVGGVAAACREAGCALLGGETAEMPGVYAPGEIDLVGTIVGVVEREGIVDGSAIRPGDAILALPAGGLHTNGYSLAHQVLGGLDWRETLPALGGTIGEALLAVHRSYLEPLQQLRAAGVEIRGLAHITGGGVIDNLPRILPGGIGAVIRRGAWPVPPIFDLIREVGQVSDAEMFHVFNMGLGMLIVIAPAERQRVLELLAGDVFEVGHVVPGPAEVRVAFEVP